MIEQNPITRRLEELQSQWLIFTGDKAARVLIWQVVDGEVPMVDAFVASEAEEHLAQTPDLFLRLESPFASESGHGFALASELVAQYEKLAQAGEVPENPWVHPRTDTRRGDIQVLLEVLASFRVHHVGGESASKLGIWLDPDNVSSQRGYEAWLLRLLERSPEPLRFFLLDDRNSPSFSAFANAVGARARTFVCDLHMLDALGEILAQPEDGAETEADSPDVQFAKLQVELAKSVERGDLAEAERHAATAVKFAEVQGCPHLASVAQMTLAAGYVAKQKPNEALAAYSEAERFGAMAEAQAAETNGTGDGTSSKEPDGAAAAHTRRQLRLHARLGQGAVLLMVQAYKHAAKVYEAAAELALSVGAKGLALDAYRLASFSRSELGQADPAWDLGMRGFQLGLELDEKTRRSSTLPFLADQLLRLTERHVSYGPHRRPLEERIAKELGVRWRDALVVGGAR